METKTLTENYHINFPEEFRIRFIKSKTEREVMHKHDFFEIFYTQSDNFTHIVNNKVQLLSKGCLVFIRPDDIHLFTHKDGPYSFINISFTKKMFYDTMKYLDYDPTSNSLLYSELSPYVFLTKEQQSEIKKLFNGINSIKHDDSLSKKRYCKKLLSTIFIQYIVPDSVDYNTSQIPLWLYDVCEQMENPDNLFYGIDAMVKISGKSYEHLSRTIKKYCNKTLSQFVNDLRINYASNLLLNSNMSITDIAFSCGFNNLSYFSKYFREHFGSTPFEFKKSHR